MVDTAAVDAPRSGHAADGRDGSALNIPARFTPPVAFDHAQFLEDMRTRGCAVVKDVLSPEFVRRAKVELESAIEKEVAYHGNNRDYKDYGMVMLCALYGGVFWEILDNPRMTEPFDAVLGDGCIVYAYTSSSMPPSGTNFSRRVHIDCPRVIPGYVTNMAATILLDDFTEENGATWYLPGSQERTTAPSEDYFYQHAERVIAPAGSVWFFNARVWHAGGVNQTNQWRHAMTFNICRPWMKQRIDIPRALADVDTSGMSDAVRQKLGYFAQTPASYEEYYVPPEQRKWRQPVE